jgi:4-aminobutyrate aminotransferase-like enzyme
VTLPTTRASELRERLRAREQRNVTFIGDDFPIFWESASGTAVVDSDGKKYLDCTAAFGVANAGHCNPRVVQAVTDQARRLMHGMGDLHPTEIRVRLFERLTQILPPELDRAFLATSGSESVEAALKTAVLATGKSRFAAYRGAYHGLSFGALGVGGIDRFRAPFAAALPAEPLLLEYPRAGSDDAATAARAAAQAIAAHDDLAALLIEPIQGRAGAVVPPPGYLSALREVCDERGILMIVDEIFTGFGRTGAWFAFEHDGVVPDIACIGKGLGSGFPISATVGRAAVMDAWPPSTGEALHTSTYLGNPMGCAAALATIDEIERLQLPARAARLGERLASLLEPLRARPEVVDVRGRGLCWAVQLRDVAHANGAVRRALAAGTIFLQAGVDGDTVAVSPPLVITESECERAVGVLARAIAEAS